MTRRVPPRPAGPRAAAPRGRDAARGPASGTAARPREPHCYLLVGEEDVRAEEALRALLDELVPVEWRALNVDVVDAAETPARDIITRCETLPFLGPRRVLIVRRAEALRAADQDALASYLEPAPPPSAAVLVAETLDRRRRLYAVIQRTGRVIPCGRLDPAALPGWIRAWAQAEGKTIGPEAARRLALLVGGGLRELGLEVAKLAAYTGDRREITADDVEAIASHVAEATIFELMDAVGRRRAGWALGLLQTVLTMGEPPVRVLYMLEDHLRMLLRTAALMRRRAGRAEQRDVLGNRAWLYARYEEQVAAFDSLDPAGMLALLLETDAAIKTGVMAPRLALETLIVRLCAPGSAAADRPAAGARRGEP